MRNPERREGPPQRSTTKEILANNPELAAIYDAYPQEGTFQISEDGKIVSDGKEYLDMPRMRELVSLGNAIRESLPEVPDEHVRLWRGNRPKEVGLNPSYTNSLEGIALPFLRSYNGVLSYVDVPVGDADEYLLTDGVAEGSEFRLPEELVAQARLVGFDEEEAERIKSESERKNNQDLDDLGGWGSIQS